MSGYDIDDDPARIDRDAVWAFLSEHVYWGKWRSREILEEQLDKAWRLVGAYAPDGRLVGFARAFSDEVSAAYLADVYVEPEHRGQGLGEAIVRKMIDEGPGAEFRWMLHTSDAHGLYAKFGFEPPEPSYLERNAAPARTSVPKGDDR